MKSRLFFVGIISGLLLTPLSLSAHHNWLSQFDPDKPVIVAGTVVELRMVNPHARLLVDEVLENGDVFHWNFEMAAASMLMRQGIRRDTLEPGDIVEVHAALARNVDNIANVEFVAQFDTEGNEIFRFGSARQ
ncbi:MAG: DUF6152 family protein [Gammaproteobacteria bacterium]|nr:DUF6152 family protein [Gammaproteobacteria bacterium]